MNTFDRAVEYILRFEGDYSNDPHDPGGETKFGISKRAYPDLSIKDITSDQAKDIYLNDYWNRCKCSELPGPLAFIVFDCAVNQGVGRAITLLQKSLNVTADGVIGAETIAAAHRASPTLVVAEMAAQRAYQYSLHPEIKRYGLGWFRRLSTCQQIALTGE